MRTYEYEEEATVFLSNQPLQIQKRTEHKYVDIELNEQPNGLKLGHLESR